MLPIPSQGGRERGRERGREGGRERGRERIFRWGEGREPSPVFLFAEYIISFQDATSKGMFSGFKNIVKSVKAHTHTPTTLGKAAASKNIQFTNGGRQFFLFKL